MRLVRKQRRPFLLLPFQSRAAAATLELYPAQTARARVARTLLRLALRCGLAAGTEKVQFIFRPASAFGQFISRQADRGGEFPVIGVLAGNAATPGQRFLVLVFDKQLRPVAVVKAGTTGRAIELVHVESAFLSAAPAHTRGVPKLRGALNVPGLSALALDFFPGHSPQPQDSPGLLPLLSSWVDASRQVRVSELSDWTRLKSVAGASKELGYVATYLEGTRICPAICHGDFAPWNIKVSPRGDWTVLDWERGQLIGMPAWDWFHYWLQQAMLVERVPVSILVGRVESLLASDPSKEYFGLAGISGAERPLLLAYLHHCIEVIKPSEGLSATRDLLTALQSRWAGRLGG